MILVWGFLISFFILFAWLKLKQLNIWDNCWFSSLYKQKLQKIWGCEDLFLLFLKRHVLKENDTVKMVILWN